MHVNPYEPNFDRSVSRNKRKCFRAFGVISFVLGLVAFTPAFYLLTLKGATQSSDDAIELAQTYGTTTPTVILLSIVCAMVLVLASALMFRAASSSSLEP